MTVVAESYHCALRCARACPWLFLVPAGFEIAQHAAEWHAGFYAGSAAMRAAEHDPLRMVLGHCKVIALFFTGWWAVRFYGFGDDPAAAVRWDGRAAALFVPVMAWGLLGLVLVQDGPMLAAAAGWPARATAVAVFVMLLASTAFDPCLSAWKAATVLGDARIGFGRSVALTRGSYWWSLGVSLGAILPLMALHYAMAVLALGRPPVATALVLAADSLLVAYLGAVMMAATWVIARRVAARAGLTLGTAGGELAEARAPVSA